MGCWCAGWVAAAAGSIDAIERGHGVGIGVDGSTESKGEKAKPLHHTTSHSVSLCVLGGWVGGRDAEGRARQSLVERLH